MIDFCSILVFILLTAMYSLVHSQTTIEVEFKPISGVTDYTLQWKEYPAKWDNAGSKAIVVSGKKKTKVEATDLQPGSTYCVRLVAAGMDEPGPELIIDTEQVGCTPKSSGKCVIL